MYDFKHFWFIYSSFIQFNKNHSNLLKEKSKNYVYLQALLDASPGLKSERVSSVVAELTGLQNTSRTHSAICSHISQLSKQFNLSGSTRKTVILVLDKVKWLMTLMWHC